PRVEAVFSNNELVRTLFENYGLRVHSTPLLENVSGTLVRTLMATGGDWKSKLPPGTARVVEEINGVERVRVLWRLSHRVPGERF
ncbi:MAG: nicotinate-nucleotide adenylyltransferase, partial [Desulfurococcaceae archaeon]